MIGHAVKDRRCYCMLLACIQPPHVSYAEMKRSLVPAPGVTAQNAQCTCARLRVTNLAYPSSILGFSTLSLKTLDMVEASSVR